MTPVPSEMSVPYKILTNDACTSLMEKAPVKTAKKGTTLVERGDIISDVFLLLDGLLRIFVCNEDGKEATLYRLRAGEICLLSLNTAFTNGRYPAWVTVESPSARFMLFSGAKVRDLFSKDISVQNMVLSSLTMTVQELITHLDEVLLSPLKERVLHFLLCNADQSGKVKITHQELASHLGVARESVSRELSSLKRSGKISPERGYIRILS